MTTESPRSILHRIGNTSLVPLRHVVPANGARIPAELPAPEAVADDRNVRDSGRVVLRAEDAPVCGGNPQNGKVVPCHEQQLHALRHVAAGGVRADRQEAGDIGKQIAT